MAEIFPVESFDHVQRFGRWFTQLVQPHLTIEADRVYDQGVTVPLSKGIAKPGWSQFFQRPPLSPIQEDLPPEVECLMDKNEEVWRLNDFPRRRCHEDLRGPLRETIRIRLFPPMQTGSALIIEG